MYTWLSNIATLCWSVISLWDSSAQPWLWMQLTGRISSPTLVPCRKLQNGNRSWIKGALLSPPTTQSALQHSPHSSNAHVHSYTYGAALLTRSARTPPCRSLKLYFHIQPWTHTHTQMEQPLGAIWGSVSCQRIPRCVAWGSGDLTTDFPISGWPVLPLESQPPLISVCGSAQTAGKSDVLFKSDLWDVPSAELYASDQIRFLCPIITRLYVWVAEVTTQASLTRCLWWWCFPVRKHEQPAYRS